MIQNGSAIPKGETPVYDNPAFSNRTYDEEMIIGEDKKPRALSHSSSLRVYENVNGKDVADSAPNGTASSTGKGTMSEEMDNVSQSTGTVYENMEVKAHPDPYIEIIDDKKAENGAAVKFEKKGASTPQSKAPVTKKAAPSNPKLGKAQSAVDVSTTDKKDTLDKTSPHKKSAPCLGSSELSTYVNVDALKDSGMASSKGKSTSAQELKRQSIAASIKEEDIKEVVEPKEEDTEEKGPGK